ncbi:YraN family protein [Patescibacteria group bacterium]|nr:YraN family protein [Candidatus Falkowbacteria bacterium]MBU3905925.1 YraN family protein [Patescibacteria group bacterium]MCG2698603.1 YraN family protein [Candidatus Parcubacteria bacterium]MBU4015052.1 YraN family protein [Patescibacteria group bacterium]MBU4026377.1 YraN family protein [Patescibacteria group bacterium]
MNHNQKVGQFGEKLAIDYLTRKGYKIIDKNIKISYREIDVIARKNNGLIFIEVKTRTSDKFGFADEAVSSKKIKRLKTAISAYLKNDNSGLKNLRLDLIAIDINKGKKIAKIKHYKDIF